jgi:PAS domain S-box-containing protein
VVSFVDITQRLRNEASLAEHESEERFRIMANTAPVMIRVSAEDASIDFCNKTWLDFTGRTLEQELAGNWTDGVHPNDLPKCLDTYRSAFHARRPFTMEYRLRRHDGEYRWVLDSGVPRFTSGGEFTGLIGSCIDITGRKQVEEASRLLASIVESSSDAIIGKTLDGIIVSWNPAAQRLYGYSAEEAIGQSISMLAPPDRTDEIPSILERIKRGERVGSFETVRLSKDGRHIEISLAVSPIIGPDGVPIGASAIARDISERKRAEEMRDLAVSEERQRIAREMHDSVAQVLGYVNTQAEAAQRLLRAGETTRATKQLQQLGVAAREVYDDVREDILGLRVSLGKEHDLASTLREYLPRWQIQSGVTAEFVVTSTEDGPPPLDAGVDLQVLRIIQEALSNVRKHSHAQRAWVRLLEEPGELRVTIEDDGDGFEPDMVVEGRLGHFGMSVMRERAASIGADLAVESAPGRGTRVRLCLPFDDRQGVTTGGSHARPHS